MTDKPDNATDQPHDLAEDASDQRDAGQAGMAPAPAAEVGAPADTPSAAEAEVDQGRPAEAPVEAAAETPAGQPPVEAVAEAPAEQPAVETPPEPPAPEPVAAEAEVDEGQPAEAPVEAVAEAPAEQPPGETPPEPPAPEPVAAEAEVDEGRPAEPPAEAVAETAAEQPPVETPPEPPAPEPVAAGAEVDEGRPAEAPAEAVAEAPAEQPPGETPPEPPAEVVPEPPAEAPVEAVAEAPPEQPEAVAETPAEAEAEAPEPSEEEPKSEDMDWYILKVQSNREDSIREGLMRRVGIAGLGRYFGQVIVPTEQVTEFKGGKKRVTKRKLYPGYLVVQMEINDDTWFLVRETPGIGDFTGAAGHPTPMLEHEVSRILAKQEEKSEKAPKLKIGFSPGDQVKINEGTFENFEGEVDSIDQTNGQVTVMINIFGRSTPVTLEYWQIEAV